MKDLIIDCFAGGGGASVGIEMALGRPVDIAIKNFYIDHWKVPGGLVIKTLEGEHLANIGDYIIRGVHGEFYPCKPDIFRETYEKVE